MKNISFAFLLLLSVWALPACNGNNGDEKGTTDTSNTNATHASTDTTRGPVSPGPDSTSPQISSQPADNESKEFVTKAASGGMMEVELGKVAQQKAKSQRVKDFGSMMVTDHTKANDELKGLAASNNITVPASMLPDHQKHFDMMKNKSGADFDKAYINMMVDDHKEDIDEFKNEANSPKNDVFKNFAAKTLPVLQKHLDSAQAIHKKM